MISSEFWKHLHKHEEYQSSYWYRSPLQWNPVNFCLQKNQLNFLTGYKFGTLVSTLVAFYGITFIFLSFLKVFQTTFLITVVSLGEIMLTSFGYVLGIMCIINQKIFCQCLNGIFQLARKPPIGKMEEIFYQFNMPGFYFICNPMFCFIVLHSRRFFGSQKIKRTTD